MPSAKTPLILPIEGQSRELDAKLLLACVAAERGFSPIFGSLKGVNREILRFPRGIYLAKDLRRAKRGTFKILENLGHVIAAVDEESLVRFPPEDFYRRRLSPSTPKYISHLFAWGEDDAALFRAYPALRATPVHATGNPRMDLLRPEIRGIFDADVAEIRERYGRFILLNTRFTHVNNYSLAKNRKGIDAGGEESVFARGYADHQQALFEEFSDLVPMLAAEFPDHTIVVRPHPREDHAVWHRAAQGFGNVRVVHEKTVAPWLIAAEAVIHNGCTTAVETAVLGKTAVAFRPIRTERYDHELPNSLSIEVFDRSELCAVVRKLVGGEPLGEGDARRRAILERHVAACTGPLAADRIVDVFVEAGYRDRNFERPGLLERLRARRAVNRRRLKRGGFSGGGTASSATDPRFPGTTVEALAVRIRQLSENLGRFEGLSVVGIGDQVFRIEA